MPNAISRPGSKASAWRLRLPFWPFTALLDRQKESRNVFAWSLLAFVFVLMSVDELVSFHEVSVKPLRNAFQLSGIFYYSWVLIVIPLVATLGLLLIPFLLRINRGTALRFILAGAIFVGGRRARKLICGYLATNGGLETAAYKFVAATQEVMENVGMTLFVVSLLRHIAIVSPSIRLSVHGPLSPPSAHDGRRACAVRYGIAPSVPDGAFPPNFDGCHRPPNPL